MLGSLVMAPWLGSITTGGSPSAWANGRTRSSDWERPLHSVDIPVDAETRSGCRRQRFSARFFW
jgi:hypothetical protein